MDRKIKLTLAENLNILVSGFQEKVELVSETGQCSVSLSYDTLNVFHSHLYSIVKKSEQPNRKFML